MHKDNARQPRAPRPFVAKWLKSITPRVGTVPAQVETSGLSRRFSSESGLPLARKRGAFFFSVRVHARLLDQRSPLVDLGLQVLLQRGRRLLLRSVRDRPELGEFLL